MTDEKPPGEGEAKIAEAIKDTQLAPVKHICSIISCPRCSFPVALHTGQPGVCGCGLVFFVTKMPSIEMRIRDSTAPENQPQTPKASGLLLPPKRGLLS